jgi:hypothetical protein
VQYQIVATGASAYYVIGNLMPYGMALNSVTGMVTGTPTMSGSTSVQIKVVDGNGHSALANLAVKIATDPNAAPPTISNQTIHLTVGTSNNAQVAATNATNYQVISGTLPPDVTLDTFNGNVTGTPHAENTTTVTIEVKNGAGAAASAEVTFELAWPPATGPAPTISDQSVTGTVGKPVQYQIVAQNATAYYVTGNLMPYGLQLSTSGQVTGTPTMSGHTNLQIKVMDDSGRSAFANLEVTISGDNTSTSAKIANQTFYGTAGTAMSVQIEATGATAYRVLSGSLPDGLSLNATTGAVTGTPQTATNTNAMVEVSDGNGGVASANMTFSISAPPPPDAGGPTISDQTINGMIEQPLTAQVQATNATKYWITSGTIPPGLTMDPATGAIAGTPTVAGTKTVTVQVTDASAAQATAHLTFVIGGTNTTAVITNVSVDPGDHTSGVTLSVTYSREVSVTLQPILRLTIGGQPVTAKFGYPDLSGSNRKVIQFFYGVTDGVHGTLAVQSPIDLLGGNIEADDGSAAELTFNPPDTSGVYIGTPPPTSNDQSSAEPPPPPKTPQTIAFAAPSSPLVVGQPIKLDATSSLGLPIAYTLQGGDASIKDGVLTPLSTDTIVVRAANAGSDTVSAASAQVNFGNPKPVVAQSVVGGARVDATTDKPLTLTSTTTPATTDNAATPPVTYSVVSGPAVITGDTVHFTGSGNVTVAAVVQVDSTHQTTETMTVQAHPVARLVNISSRVHIFGNGDGATVGFVVTGTEPKQILIRAVGDSLATFGVSDGVANPTLTLYDASSVVTATNSGWAGAADIAAAAKTVGAFAFASGKTDAALLRTLAPGLYTAQVTSPNSGSALVEVYDVGAPDPVPTKQLINISTRAHVDAANQVVQGFAISGDQPKRVLLRAVGPALRAFGVGDAIADPNIQLFSGAKVVASNDDWSTPATATDVTTDAPAEIAKVSASVGAFGLPAGGKDAALLVTLQPGLYTAAVSGSSGESGSVLVEAYEVP